MVKDLFLKPYTEHQRIYLLRFFSGLSQAEMASALGVTQGWISKMEAGFGEVTLGILSKIRDRFGVSSDDFIDDAIPYAAIAAKSAKPLPVATHYLEPAGTRIRLATGFVQHFGRRLGPKKTEAALKELGMRIELFAEPRLLVSARLFADLASFGFDRGLLKTSRDWETVAGALELESTSGDDKQAWQESLDLALKGLREETRDFRIELKETGAGKAEISVHPSSAVSGKLVEEKAACGFYLYYQAALSRIGSSMPGLKLVTEPRERAGDQPSAESEWVFDVRRA